MGLLNTPQRINLDCSNLPKDMTFEQGALVEPLAVSHRAIARTGANSRDTVAIIGGGTIGQFCLADAVAAGVKETLITVKYEQQAELAKALGADHVVNISDTNVQEYVKDVTNGLGFDAVVENGGRRRKFRLRYDYRSETGGCCPRCRILQTS